MLLHPFLKSRIVVVDAVALLFLGCQQDMVDAGRVLSNVDIEPGFQSGNPAGQFKAVFLRKTFFHQNSHHIVRMHVQRKIQNVSMLLCPELDKAIEKTANSDIYSYHDMLKFGKTGCKGTAFL